MLNLGLVLNPMLMVSCMPPIVCMVTLVSRGKHTKRREWPIWSITSLTCHLISLPFKLALRIRQILLPPVRTLTPKPVPTLTPAPIQPCHRLVDYPMWILIPLLPALTLQFIRLHSLRVAIEQRKMHLQSPVRLLILLLPALILWLTGLRNL